MYTAITFSSSSAYSALSSPSTRFFVWSAQYPSAQTQISNSTGSPSTIGRSDVAVNVLIPLPAQTSENGSASSTSSRAVPWPCTWPCQRAAASDSFMPGSSLRRTWCIAWHAISFAMRRRAISCSVLIIRARASSGAASAASGNASNHAFVNVVGSPTIRSVACVPSESSSPMRRCSRLASIAASSVRAGTGRGSVSS